jgi:hypothetical protein
LFLRKKDGSFAARQDVQLKLAVKISGLEPGELGLARAVTNPHLLDWDGDGHNDLVVAHTEGWLEGRWTLYVCAGPLAGKTELTGKAFALPKVPDAEPVYFGFADWDGDGRVDLLAAVRYQKGIDAARVDPQKRPDKTVSYSIYWFRNTTDWGEPKFAPAAPLLTMPAPWELDGFTVVKGGKGGRPDLVVSVSKNIRSNPKDGYFSVEANCGYTGGRANHRYSRT